MMDDEKTAALAAEQSQPEPKMQLIINLMPGDQIQVTGPLENEALFDWMLKKAGQAAESWRNEQAQDRAREAAKPNTLLGRLKQLAPVRKH